MISPSLLVTGHMFANGQIRRGGSLVTFLYALQVGLEQKAKEFKKFGADVYAKA